MVVYIVFMENGSIYGIYKRESEAVKVKGQLDMLYENATIKKFKVN